MGMPNLYIPNRLRPTNGLKYNIQLLYCNGFLQSSGTIEP